MKRSDHPASADTPALDPWPEDVTARYLTVGGATVGITVENADPANPLYVPRCGGCGTTDPRDLDEYDARIWAQTHAEKCRALPRPEVTS